MKMFYYFSGHEAKEGDFVSWILGDEERYGFLKQIFYPFSKEAKTILGDINGGCYFTFPDINGINNFNFFSIDDQIKLLKRKDGSTPTKVLKENYDYRSNVYFYSDRTLVCENDKIKFHGFTGTVIHFDKNGIYVLFDYLKEFSKGAWLIYPYFDSDFKKIDL